MERMGQRDLEALLAFVREIYADLDLGSFASKVVSLLPKAIPSEWTSYNEVNPRSQTNTYVMEPVPSNFPEGEEVFVRHMPEHPIIRYHQETHDGRALKISDLLTQREFHRLGLYNEFFRRLEVEHQMAIVLPAPAPLVIGIAVNRSGKDFSEKERLLLDQLRPHLIQAYRNAESVARLQQDAAYLSKALEELDRGVIVLTNKTRVQLCTGKAREWLSEYFEPSPGRDELPESLQRWVEHQRLLLSDNGDVPPPCEPLIVGRPGRRIMLRLVADDSEGRHLLLLERQVPFSTKSLESLGLTHREAEILLWVTRGKTNKEIASALYISSRTVKKHLEHIYEKIGVESRAKAMVRTQEILGLPQI
jgi:DNA-binding CsgD family transcriptional regulator